MVDTPTLQPSSILTLWVVMDKEVTLNITNGVPQIPDYAILHILQLQLL